MVTTVLEGIMNRKGKKRLKMAVSVKRANSVNIN